MKKIAVITAILVIMILPVLLNAQPHPYDSGIGGGAGQRPVGGSSPLGGGIIMMLMMAFGYGMRTFYYFRKKAIK